MENIARILDKLDNWKEELYEILQTLIRFRTPNPPGGDEKEAQQRIAARLRKLGFEVDIFEALPGAPLNSPFTISLARIEKGCKRMSRTKSAGWHRQTSGCASTLRS